MSFNSRGIAVAALCTLGVFAAWRSGRESRSYRERGPAVPGIVASAPNESDGREAQGSVEPSVMRKAASFLSDSPEGVKEPDEIQQPAGANSRLELAWLESRPHRLPTLAELRSLTESDRETVLQAYRACQGLTNRIAATVALAMLGGGSAYNVFTNTLGSEFRGISLGSREWRVMEFTMQGLGLIDRSWPAAGDFLVGAREAEFWVSFRGWSCSDPALEEFCPTLLAGTAWQALGFANRPDIEEERKALRDRNPLSVQSGIAGRLMDGAYFRDLVEAVGIDGVVEIWATPGEVSKRLRDWWLLSEAGKGWAQWKSDYDRWSVGRVKE